MRFDASSPPDVTIVAKRSLLSAATLVRGRHGISEEVSENNQLEDLEIDSLAMFDVIAETHKSLEISGIRFSDTTYMDDAFGEALDNGWTLARLAQRIIELRKEEARILELKR